MEIGCIEEMGGVKCWRVLKFVWENEREREVW